MQRVPSQPNINRGTMVLLAPNAADAAISSKNVFFVFQYNPEKLIHTFNQGIPNALAANTADQQGPTSEFFNLTFELDSLDVYGPSQNQSSANLGLHPALALLELMMQPQVAGKQAFMPIVVFKWGAKRLVPVRFVSMSVEEKSFDATLNPTRAMVSLTLRVLDATESKNNPGARNVLLDHQNVQTTLVDAYKLQTKQAFPLSGNPLAGIDNSSLAASVFSGSGVQGKTKKSV
jgi:hypothetical protein